jgi:ubiquinone/menaquinone biosynthesis C-methylase UbiE
VSESKDVYTHGYHESVLRSHTWRTAENSAGFLLPHLGRGARLLDVGCGPGTISADLARLLAPGLVTAIDISEEVIEKARTLQGDQSPENLEFRIDNVYELSFPDSSFDVVYAHQVLQHLSDPVAAIVEMRRVLREGGLLAVRDADFGAFTWFPADDRLTKWLAIYHELTMANGAQADAGRHLAHWVREAGFTSMTFTSSNWNYASEAERRWWGQLWADRVRHSDFATQALAYRLATKDELDDIAEGFIEWSKDEEGLFIVVNGEVLARR